MKGIFDEKRNENKEREKEGTISHLIKHPSHSSILIQKRSNKPKDLTFLNKN